jgi:adenylosuccinate lyase
MVKGAVEQVWLPTSDRAGREARDDGREPARRALLAHTHGQPATPTTLGKELAVLAWRLQRQLAAGRGAAYLGKLNGATGTYGAHLAAVPGARLAATSRAFVEPWPEWNPLTTQIESHDWQAELYADIARFNRVLHNLCTDVWTYISMGYFAQVRGQGTVGSTMPHKVNPIRFENAEANLEVSNALFDVLAATLVRAGCSATSPTPRCSATSAPPSGTACSPSTTRRGLAGLDAVPAAMAADLDANWEVLAEPIQSAMRALGAQGVPGMEEPYERLKELTRGRRIGQADLEFDGLGLRLTPAAYVGLAPRWSTTWAEPRLVSIEGTC